MKIILIGLFLFILSSSYANVVVVPPRNQNFFYYPPYNNYYYDYYTPYQPDNGPMRGPNSIEGHKSPRERYRDFRYR